MQTPTKQQGAPQNPGPKTEETEETGEKRGPRKGKTKQERGTKAHPGSAQAAPIFLAWCKSGPALFPGGEYQRLRQLSPPGCAAHPFRMAAVLDGVPEDGVVPHHHAAPFAMSSMRLSAAASRFRRISSQMALETWSVWVVWLNLNLGTFWSTMETSRNGAEGSTRR